MDRCDLAFQAGKDFIFLPVHLKKNLEQLCVQESHFAYTPLKIKKNSVNR